MGVVTTINIEDAYNRGFQLRTSGQYPEAKRELLRVLEADPTHVPARHQLGLIQGFEGDFDGSLVTLDALARQNPHNMKIRYDLAMTQMMLGMYDEACAHLRYILTVDPSHEEAMRQSAYC